MGRRSCPPPLRAPARIRHQRPARKLRSLPVPFQAARVGEGAPGARGKSEHACLAHRAGQWIPRFSRSTPFLLATSTEDTELMRFLTAHGADPKITTNTNVTPLMAVAGINRGNSRPEDALNGFRDAVEAVKLAIELGNDIQRSTTGARPHCTAPRIPGQTRSCSTWWTWAQT